MPQILECPVHHIPLEFTGTDDGGGDYGTSVCDYYSCPECDYIEELNCFDLSEYLFGAESGYVFRDETGVEPLDTN